VIAAGKERKIAVTAKQTSAGVQIRVLDTGLGVPKDWSELFEPFVADPTGSLYKALKKHLNPADSFLVGRGTGLGLSIAKEVVESHEGTIRFGDLSGGWKCNLEIVVPT
jgi:two-component system sensor histidine kinase VicK